MGATQAIGVPMVGQVGELHFHSYKRYNKLQEYNKVGVEVSDSQGKQAISHPRGGHGSVTLTIQDNRNDRGNEARKSLEHPGCSTGAGD